MYGQLKGRRSPNGVSAPVSRNIQLYVVTLLFVASIFFFVTFITMNTLGNEEITHGLPVNSNLVKFGSAELTKWEEKILQSPWLKDIHFLGPHEHEHISAPTPHPAPEAVHAPSTQDSSSDSGSSGIRISVKSSSGNSYSNSGSAVKGDTKKPKKARNWNFHELQCPHKELVTFWKRASKSDLDYITPYSEGPNAPPKYVTFEPDVGGWNNIRMQMELVLVLAYATGRILVLPPDQPMYLLNKGKGHQKHHSFADFFPFEYIKQRLPVISMEEFMAREAVTGGLKNLTTSQIAYPPHNKTVWDATERAERLAMWDYLRGVGACPKWKCMKDFLVVPPAPGMNTSHLPPAQAAPYKKKLDIFAAKRNAVYYDEYWHSQKVIHFISKPGLGYRLLEHFYTFIHFQDDAMDRLFKRFVRDYVHYIDIIFCRAAKIIHKILEESGGSFSAFHIRRGEFQYKDVKIPSADILKNVGQFMKKDQLVYVATDERNKTFFDAFKNHFKAVKYLDDYMDFAGLKTINPNFLGMIDAVICTRGETFVGTWFSTFSGYITRLRGYMGYLDSSVYYGDKAHRDRFQHAELPKFPFYMREWNVSWWNIEEDR